MSTCTVCGAEVDAQVLRETVHSDWEYRYQAMLIWNFEPGTEQRHRCRLTPRRFTVAAAEAEEPVVAVVRETEYEQESGRGGVPL